jgi:hypothetical protein
MAKAINCMIIDHTDRLHEGVANRRANEFETAPDQVFAHSI